MKRIPILLAVGMLFATAAFAQDDDSKLQVFGNYSYMRFVPQNNNIIQSFSLNGGGGGVAFYLTSMIGIKAEFEGYGSTTRHYTLPASVCGTGGVCSGNVQANLFTYNVGPVVRFHISRVQPFVEALFGGAHSNVYGNLLKACGGATVCVFSKSPSNNAFDFIIGGGLDVPVSERISIRPAQFDYVLTRFGNNFTGGNNNQSNFRFQAGVVFRF